MVYPVAIGMTFSKEVLDFWEKVKTETGITGDFVDAYGFGDNPELMDELLGYVVDGIKRTSSSRIGFRDDGLGRILVLGPGDDDV